MTRWVARVTVALKPSVNDPQGLAVLGGLHSMGFPEVLSVRIGKHIELALDAENERAALQRADAMSRQLLANTLIETYSISLDERDAE